jgi:hypothetical protein
MIKGEMMVAVHPTSHSSDLPTKESNKEMNTKKCLKVARKKETRCDFFSM